MTNLPQNVNEKQELSASLSTTSQNTEVIVSIIFTDSTSSLLKLDLPHVEDLNAEDSQPSVCVIRARCDSEELNHSEPSLQTQLSELAKVWFHHKSEASKTVDCKNVASDIGYFYSSTNFRDSLESILSMEQFQNGQASIGCGESSSSLKLKPRKVHMQPLRTIRSLAHENLMKSEQNTIYIRVLNSKAKITESGWINVCRICHGGESFGNLLAPCRCRGSIALTHMECLERWLKESTNSKCELCQHHFKIIRQPKYSVPKSIFVFLRHPGEHLNELLFDLFAFLIYTPAAIASTYMLMLLCESVAKTNTENNKTATAHVVTLAAIFVLFQGMAAIDFTYSSWFMVNLQKHIIAWRSWYRDNCDVKVVLPSRKHRHEAFESSVDEFD